LVSQNLKSILLKTTRMPTKVSKEFALISEISDLLDSYKLKHVDVLGNEDSNSRYTEFWRLTKNGTITNDEEAAQHFYGDNANNPNYKKFRLEFRERLINTILHIDAFHPNLNDFDSAFQSCYLKLAIVQVLLSTSCNKSAIVLLKEIIEQSLKYEFVEVSFIALTRLKRLLAQAVEDKKEYDKYNEIYKSLEQDYYNEIKATNCYDDLLACYIQKRAIQNEAFVLGEKYLRELKPFFVKSAGLKFILNYSLIAVIKCISGGDYNGLDKACDTAIDYLQSKPYNAVRNIAVFYNQKITANRQLKKYDIALLYLEKALSMQLEGTNNWFTTKELSVTLNLHTGEYQRAWEIFSATKAHKKFKHLSDMRKEDWLIIEGYLVCLIKLGKIQAEDNSFSIKKVLYQLDMSEKDKEGRNVSILILQIIDDIINDREDNLMERIDTLSKYRSRYIQGDSEARAYLFVKLLKGYAQNGCNKKAALKDLKADYKNLVNEKYDINDQNHALEVIPFEQLWMLIMRAV
jgi:hypothetical protein